MRNENDLIDIQYVIDSMRRTLIKVFHLQSFDMVFSIESFNMPLKFKFDCDYKDYTFNFVFRIFDHEYSNKISLEKLIEKRTIDFLKQLRSLTKKRKYTSLYGEEYQHVIAKRWLNRRLKRKLPPKLKSKVVKI